MQSHKAETAEFEIRTSVLLSPNSSTEIENPKPSEGDGLGLRLVSKELATFDREVLHFPLSVL
jgi:hypothetical protein